MKGKLQALLVRMSGGGAIMKDGVEVPQRLNIELPSDPAILVLGRDPKGLKSGS